MATVIEVMAKLTGNASGMIATFKQAQAAAKQTSDTVAATGAEAKASFDSLVLPAGVIAGGVAVIGSKMALMASEAEQNVGAVESVFKQYAQTVKDTSAQAAESVGISQSAYQQFSSIVGSQLKNMGVPLKDVAGGTDDLIKKGADLASMFGGTTSEAIEAISSMLRGETDPIERYGVSINEAAVEAEMAAMGLKGLTGEAEKNGKLQAKLAILNRQTADATGNFGREADTAAGAMQRANAKFEDAQATLGANLLPVMTKVAEMLAGLSKFASENSTAVLFLGIVFGGAALALLSVAGAMKAYTIAAEAAKVATYLFGTAQKAVMAFSIIGILMLIVGAFVALWMTSEDFRNFWIGLWNELVKAVAPFTNAVSAVFNDVVGKIGQFLGDVGRAAEGIWSIFAKGDFKGGIFGLEEDSALVDFLFDVRDAAIGLWDIIAKGDFTGPIFGLEEDSAIIGFLFTVRDTVINVGKFFGDLGKAAKGVWDILASGNFTGGIFGLEEDSAFVDFLFDIRDAAKGIWDILVNGNFSGGIFGLEEDSAFVDFLFNIREGAQAAWDWIVNLGKGIADFFGGLAQGGGEDIFAHIQNSGVLEWLGGLWDRAKVIFDQLSQAWAKVWEFISNAFSVIGPPLFAYIISAFTMLWSIITGVWNAVGQPLINIIVAAWNILVDGIKAVWNIIVGVIQGAMSIIEGIIAVVTGVITGNWQQVWEGLGKILGGVWQIISSIVGNALAFIGSVISNGLAIVVNIWNGIWGAVGATLAAVWNNIGALIGSYLALIGGIVSAVFGGIWDNITGAWNGLIGWASDLWNGFVSMLSDVWANLTQGATDGVASVTNPITEGFNNLVTNITGFFTTIGEAVGAAWTWVTTLLTDIFNAFMAEHGAQLAALWAIITGIFNGIASFIAGIWNGIVAAITAAAMFIWSGIVNTFTMVWNFIVSIFTAIGAALAAAWNTYVSIISTVLGFIWGIISSVFNTVRGFVVGVFSAIGSFIGGVWNNIVAVISGAVNRVWSFISTGFNNARSVAISVFNGILSFLSGVWTNIVSGVSGMVNNVVSWFTGIQSKVVGALSGAGTWLLNAGRQVVQGFIDGISGLAGTIGNAFLSMVPGWIVGPFKKALGIASPSKLFHQFGRWIVEGLINGVHAKGTAAQKAVQTVADKLTKGAEAHLKRYDALMKKAKPLSAGRERNGLLSDARAERGMANQLFRAAGMVQAQVRRVGQLAAQKAALAKRLTDAQKKLTDATKVRNTKASETSKDLQGEFDLGALVGYSAKDMVVQTKLIGDRIRKFGEKIAQLKKQGLSAAMIDQVSQLGSVDGTIMADQLLKGGKGVIAQMNSAYAGIKANSDKAGNFVADAMYKSGVDAARGLVNGIASQMKRVDGQATAIARTLISRFRKELGIKSPSKVMEGEAGFVMQGVDNGLIKGTGKVMATMEGVAKGIAGTAFEAPAIRIPEVPNIAAQLALPPLKQDVILNFVGEYEGGMAYNQRAIGGGLGGGQQEPKVEINLTALIENPFGEGYLEAKVVTMAEAAADRALAETARAAKSKRGSAVGGW
ncbi:tape measure protein [Arthrobacter phage Ottawa]|nr:tape measure protein [Arthrobacter phage Kharcho]WIC89275.1 tape measure protein [Arthrobacter phage Ottawa]